MKYQKMLMICAIVGLCMTFQTQPVCAQNLEDQTLFEAQAQEFEMEETASAQVLEEAPQTEDDKSGQGQEIEVSTEDGASPVDTTTDGQDTQPGENSAEEAAQEGNQPGEELPEESNQEEGNQDENSQDDEQEEPVEEFLEAEKVTGLHMTCLTDKKVLLEWNESEHAFYYKIYRRQGKGAYKKLTETAGLSYTDPSVAYGKTYDYKIIPVNEAKKAGKATTIHLSHTQAVNIKTQKYTYSQMETDMRELAKQYSNYCELTAIGKSAEGRTIYDFAIGNPDAKESLLVVSTLHAREYICSAVLMREIEYYLRNYNHSLSGMTPAKVLKSMQIHYVVMANPDGVTISQTKSARWKANGRGVDLNRNFPATKFIVKGRRGSEGYSGLKALSEPESQAVASLTKNLKKKQNLLGVVNYHAMGQIVFGDCADAKIKKDTQLMYNIARQLTGYSDAGSYSAPKAVADGSYREYVMYLLGVPSITLEVGCTSAPCSYWEYESAFQKNKMVVLKIANAL